MKKGSYLPETKRQLPQNHEAEKAIISSCLLDQNVIADVSNEISTEHFYFPNLREIYGVILEMAECGEPIDLMTVTARLGEDGKLGTIGGAAALSELFTFVPSATNWDYYAEILREKKYQRDCIAIGTELAGFAYENKGEELEKKAGESLLSISQESKPKTKRTIAQAALNVLHNLRNHDIEKVVGISTGFDNLDAVDARLRKGGVVFIAGDTSSGKTSLAMNIVKSFSADRSLHSVVMSAEMSQEEIIQTIAEIISGTNTAGVVKRTVGDQAESNYMAALDIIKKLPIEIYGQEDCGGMTIREIRALLRARKAKHQIDLVVLDYDELFLPEVFGKGMTKEMELTKLSRQAKLMAPEIDAAVIMISQLTEGQLRHAKGKANDATQVWKIMGDDSSRDLFIAKSRFGKRDTEVHFDFHGATKRFRPAKKK